MRARWIAVLCAFAGLSLATAAPAASAIPFQGQVYCATTGCNTTCAQFACDGSGRPLTSFYVNGARDPNCTSNANSPALVYNSNGNGVIGRYIDNEVDSLGSYTNRQALVNCADQEAAQLILVAEYPAETSGDVQPTTTTGPKDTVGNMLEWYPYCNGRDYYKGKEKSPPPLGSSGPNGYIAQGVFVPPGCKSGATTAEQSSLWNLEWGYVNGSTFSYTSGATTIGDLLATCEDAVC